VSSDASPSKEPSPIELSSSGPPSNVRAALLRGCVFGLAAAVLSLIFLLTDHSVDMPELLGKPLYAFQLGFLGGPAAYFERRFGGRGWAYAFLALVLTSVVVSLGDAVAYFQLDYCEHVIREHSGSRALEHVSETFKHVASLDSWGWTVVDMLVLSTEALLALSLARLATRRLGTEILVTTLASALIAGPLLRDIEVQYGSVEWILLHASGVLFLAPLLPLLVRLADRIERRFAASPVSVA
jgi:hypothetical protein